MGKPTPPSLEEICVHRISSADGLASAAVPPLIPAAVWECESTTQADAQLGGLQPGYVYQRDGHPNATWLGEQIARLHRGDEGIVCASGMAALSAILLAKCQAGDRIVISNQLYGRTSKVYGLEAPRLGIEVAQVDPLDPEQLKAALAAPTRLVLVETISNPLLRVADLEAIAQASHDAGAWLVVDNTFATPLVCRPLERGADLVVESVSKLMNGHGDLMLGAIAARGSEARERIADVVASWGFASSPFDCWLAQRGLATLGLRVERACDNAAQLAHALVGHPCLSQVDYPGLPGHPDFEAANRLFSNQDGTETRFGHVVTVHLRGERRDVDRLIRGCPEIPFCPSLGELRTTLSHPESTSHRGLSPEARERLGIHPGTIRLSVGIESPQWLVNVLRNALDSLDLGRGGR